MGFTMGTSGDDDDILEDVAPIQRPEYRHGQYLIRQLSIAHQPTTTTTVSTPT